jgi:hypothetical protein
MSALSTIANLVRLALPIVDRWVNGGKQPKRPKRPDESKPWRKPPR